MVVEKYKVGIMKQKILMKRLFLRFSNCGKCLMSARIP